MWSQFDHTLYPCTCFNTLSQTLIRKFESTVLAHGYHLTLTTSPVDVLPLTSHLNAISVLHWLGKWGHLPCRVHFTAFFCRKYTLSIWSWYQYHDLSWTLWKRQWSCLLVKYWQWHYSKVSMHHHSCLPLQILSDRTGLKVLPLWQWNTLLLPDWQVTVRVSPTTV